jgi:AhpD family alkylhydroperoxidase
VTIAPLDLVQHPALPAKPIAFYRVLARAPAGLQGYLDLKAALGKGALAAPARERIAIAVAEANGCAYCRAAHAAALRRLAAPDPDGKEGALVDFARTVAQTRGAAGREALARARAAGASDEEIVEAVAHVALNVFSNYLNLAAGTALDV